MVRLGWVGLVRGGFWFGLVLIWRDFWFELVQLGVGLVLDVVETAPPQPHESRFCSVVAKQGKEGCGGGPRSPRGGGGTHFLAWP